MLESDDFGTQASSLVLLVASRPWWSKDWVERLIFGNCVAILQRSIPDDLCKSWLRLTRQIRVRVPLTICLHLSRSRCSLLWPRMLKNLQNVNPQ